MSLVFSKTNYIYEVFKEDPGNYAYYVKLFHEKTKNCL